jgi:hypothetical protein
MSGATAAPGCVDEAWRKAACKVTACKHGSEQTQAPRLTLSCWRSTGRCSRARRSTWWCRASTVGTTAGCTWSTGALGPTAGWLCLLGMAVFCCGVWMVRPACLVQHAQPLIVPHLFPSILQRHRRRSQGSGLQGRAGGGALPGQPPGAGRRGLCCGRHPQRRHHQGRWRAAGGGRLATRLPIQSSKPPACIANHQIPTFFFPLFCTS